MPMPWWEFWPTEMLIFIAVWASAGVTVAKARAAGRDKAAARRVSVFIGRTPDRFGRPVFLAVAGALSAPGQP
jgi:hypothetical protein